jgi:sortase A
VTAPTGTGGTDVAPDGTRAIGADLAPGTSDADPRVGHPVRAAAPPGDPPRRNDGAAGGDGFGRPRRVRRPSRPLSARAGAWAIAVWALVTPVAVVLVLYGVGPLLEQRDQTALLADYRVEVRQAANQSLGLPGVEVPTRAPETGAPVAILDIPKLRIEQVVVEGVSPQQTRRGPGHVPGTRGPGQPGNSAIVGRRSAFGGPFRTLGELRPGDPILVTTIQGQTVYEVVEVRSADVAAGSGTTAADAPLPEPTEGRAETEPLPADLTVDDLFGRTPDDRLTLVTSAATRPWNTSRATIVVATMRDKPFAPTPQGGRTAADDGRSPDPGAGAPLALAALAYVVAVVIAVVLYRQARPRSAYLLATPPLLAATMLVAEGTARVLPAWL